MPSQIDDRTAGAAGAPPAGPGANHGPGHPAQAARHGPADADAPVPGGSAARPDAGGRGGVVVPLNDAAAVFEALATAIRGTAVGWSPTAVQRLADGLHHRYGDLLGPGPIAQLVALARRPAAA